MARHEYSTNMRLRPGHPVRTCIGCRQLAPAADLLRIVARQTGPEGAVVVLDPRRRLPGRGAWVHLDRRCVSQAEKRRAFGRALRVSGSLDTAAFVLAIDLDCASEAGHGIDTDHATEPHPQQSSTP